MAEQETYATDLRAEEVTAEYFNKLKTNSATARALANQIASAKRTKKDPTVPR